MMQVMGGYDIFSPFADSNVRSFRVHDFCMVDCWWILCNFTAPKRFSPVSASQKEGEIQWNDGLCFEFGFIGMAM